MTTFFERSSRSNVHSEVNFSAQRNSAIMILTILVYLEYLVIIILNTVSFSQNCSLPHLTLPSNSIHAGDQIVQTPRQTGFRRKQVIFVLGKTNVTCKYFRHIYFSDWFRLRQVSLNRPNYRLQSCYSFFESHYIISHSITKSFSVIHLQIKVQTFLL